MNYIWARKLRGNKRRIVGWRYSGSYKSCPEVNTLMRLLLYWLAALLLFARTVCCQQTVGKTSPWSVLHVYCVITVLHTCSWSVLHVYCVITVLNTCSWSVLRVYCVVTLICCRALPHAHPSHYVWTRKELSSSGRT